MTTTLPAEATFTDAAGEGHAPLTWGQRALWLAVQRRGPQSSTLISLRRIVTVPRRAAGDVGDVLRALSALIERHSSLRTKVHFVDGVQQVLATGTQPVQLVAAAPDDPDGVATAKQVAEQLAATVFDHETEMPQRIAFVLGEDRVRQIVIVFSHSTVDFQAAELVLRELRQLLLRRQIPDPPGPQSSEVARREQTDGHQRKSQRATRYWVDSFRRLPTLTLPVIGTAQQPRWRRSLLTSAAADVAVRLIARDHGVSSATVLLTAVAVTMARKSHQDVCGVYLMVNNRAVEGYRAAVSKLNQLGLVVADLRQRPSLPLAAQPTAVRGRGDGGRPPSLSSLPLAAQPTAVRGRGDGGRPPSLLSFHEALPVVWHAALQAYRHSYYDPLELAAAHEAAGLPYLEGISPHCYLNDIRLNPTDIDLFGRDTTEAAVRSAMRESTFTLAEGIDNFTWRMRVEVVDAAAGLGLTLTGDTSVLPPPVAERYLRDIEELVVQAAFHDVAWPWTLRSEAIS